MNELPPDPNEIVELVELLCQGEMTPDQSTRLEAILRADKQARQYYVRYLSMHACLPMFAGAEAGRQELARLQQTLLGDGGEVIQGEQAECACPAVPKEGGEGPVGVLGFLGECFQTGSSFLSKPGIFTLLVAVGLPGVVLLMLVMSLVNEEPVAGRGAVATVIRAHDCAGRVGDGHAPLSVGMSLAAGERLTLRKGLVELEFADGATVILEAPTAFEVQRADGGFLQMGRLAAFVPPVAHGFEVETPLATVVDLGTDFGVLVAADGTSEAHVFTGEIEVATKTMPENPTSLTKRLTVGQAARVPVPNVQHAAARIEPMSAVPDEFVRHFPAPPAPQARPSETAGRLIASVDRHGGVKGNRVPIGAFDEQTAPLKSNPSGLRLMAPLFSDRVYVIDDMSPELAGAEYVRTLLNDKFGKELDYGYDVVFTGDRERVFLIVLVDDRFERGGGEQQAAVDRIVSAFAGPGEFVDTGLYVDANDARTSHPLTAFGKWAPTKDEQGNPIKYSFRAAPSGESTFVIAAMPEEPAAPAGDARKEQ